MFTSCATTASTRSRTDKKENGGLGKDDGLHRNQFGGTIGGPIIRDKLFFFEGIQATLTKQRPTSNQTVLTADMLRGDFRNALKAVGADGPGTGCLTTARTLGAPFVDNQINPALFNQVSLKVASMVPLPDPAFDPNGCGTYIYVNTNDNTDQQYVTRVDYQATGNKRIFVRDFLAFNSDPPSFDKNQPNLLDASAGSGTEHSSTRSRQVLIRQSTLLVEHFSYQRTRGTHQRRQRADVGHARREVVHVYPRQDFRSGHAEVGNFQLNQHWHVLRQHAADLARLRLDARVAQPLVRRLLGSAGSEW
jgi:hypothetical protein